MTCQECELRLAEGEFGAGVEDHLRECAECRALARELRENSIALATMREDSVVEQALACNGGFSRRQRPRIWIPVAVAAALVLLALGLPRRRREVPPPPVPVVAAAPAPTLVPEASVGAAVARKPRRRPFEPEPAQPEETFMVKMLTPDPDVVIYWIVEPKERAE
jgi:hypothetical protein